MGDIATRYCGACDLYYDDMILPPGPWAALRPPLKLAARSLAPLVVLLLSCGDPCVSEPGSPGCPCTEKEDCAGWCTTQGCQAGTLPGEWSACALEAGLERTCDDVCEAEGQSCATACEGYASVHTFDALACPVGTPPQWALASWTFHEDLDGFPRTCELPLSIWAEEVGLSGGGATVSCCCLPGST